MRTIRQLNEDEVILEFLDAELDSPTWARKYQDVITKLSLEVKLKESADIENKAQNQSRKALLSAVRGYRDKYLFLNFPDQVDWYEAELDKDEFSEILYMKDDTWLNISNGSRKLVDGAQKIKTSTSKFGKEQAIREIAMKMSKGETFPKVILVTKRIEGPFVLMEGHCRATATAINYENNVSSIRAIVGLSPKMAEWHWI